MDKNSLLKKFGRNVKIERIKKDLTQEQLAEKLDVSQNYIANIECGKANMSIYKVYELSEKIGINIKNLFVFEE